MRYPKWMQIAFLSFFAFLLTGLLVYRQHYYHELFLVKKQFERLPGVRVVEIQGSIDNPWMEYWAEVGSGKDVPKPKERILNRIDWVSATVSIDGFGLIEFGRVTHKDFKSTDIIRISNAIQYQEKVRIGNHTVFTYGDRFTLGRNGAYSSLFPRNYRNIPEFISNINEVKQTMTYWPVCPKEKRFEDSEGYVHYYCVDSAS